MERTRRAKKLQHKNENKHDIFLLGLMKSDRFQFIINSSCGGSGGNDDKYLFIHSLELKLGGLVLG